MALTAGFGYSFVFGRGGSPNGTKGSGGEQGVSVYSRESGFKTKKQDKKDASVFWVYNIFGGGLWRGDSGVEMVPAVPEEAETGTAAPEGRRVRKDEEKWKTRKQTP